MCAVETCSMRSGRDKGVCMFRFPKDPKLKKTWVIKCRRENYVVTKHSKVCEKHFEDSDFVVSRAFAASVGYDMNLRLQLKPDAVPTIIPEPKSKTSSSSKRKLPRISMAWEKRRRLEVKYFNLINGICCHCMSQTNIHLSVYVHCLFCTVHILCYGVCIYV